MASNLTWAVIWIDTDGQFYVQNFRSLEEAVVSERIAGESGLPAMVISSREFLYRIAPPRKRGKHEEHQDNAD